MGDLVERYTAAITFIPADDQRDPPGDHQGTGWLAIIDEHPLLCTCEHVAKLHRPGQLGYSCFGAEHGISVGSGFELHPLPLDFAVASLSRTWRQIHHRGECIPSSMIGERHCPVEGEYLYFYGFPGVEAKAHFGEHYIQGTGIFLHEIDFVDRVLDEEPRVDPKVHITMSLSPARAIPLTAETHELPLPHGMSGSALWNTRYKEVAALGKQWQPGDARLTGIVWGASQKTGVLLATPIEKLVEFIRVPV